MKAKKRDKLAELIAKDTKFKKALKKNLPKLVKLAKKAIAANPNHPASKELDLHLTVIQATVMGQHGAEFGSAFVEYEEVELEG
jgi:hypothetical protein